MKRIIRSYRSYEYRPIIFNPDPNKFPGKIFFEDLLIKNKIGQNNKNILISKYNDCFDTKLNYKEHFKILTKEEFKLLYNHFKCESNYVIKLRKKTIELITIEKYLKYVLYIDFSVHLNIVLIPTISCFKKINSNEIEKFIKEHKIIYDVYFKLYDDRNAIIKELINIFKEKSYILSNMGVELKSENNEDEISEKVNDFIFYINTNKFNTYKILDDIFNEEYIKNIISGNKINIPFIKLTNNLNLFIAIDLYSHYDSHNPIEKNNIDYVENGIIFIEYIENSKGYKDKNNLSIFKLN